MKQWDLRAGDPFHPVLRICHINKDIILDESLRQVKHKVILVIQDRFQAALFSHWLLTTTNKNNSNFENRQSFQPNKRVSKLVRASNTSFIEFQRAVTPTIIWRRTDSKKKRSGFRNDLKFLSIYQKINFDLQIKVM